MSASFRPVLRTTVLAAGLAALGAGSPVLAHDLFLGGPQGTILGAEFDGMVFQTLGACGGPINSAALNGDVLLLGDLNGNVYGHNLVSDQTDYYFTLAGSSNPAMVMHAGDLLVSLGTAEIRRVNPDTGVVLDTMTAPTDVQAMLLLGNDLFVSGEDGGIYKGNADNGAFVYFGCTCLGTINALAYHNGAVLAADEFGSVVRFHKTTGAIDGWIFVPGNNSALVVVGDELLVSDSEGAVRRVDPQTGEVISTHSAGTPIAAMVLDNRPVCAADANGDDAIDTADFFAFLEGYFAEDAAADFNDDGAVNSNDFFAFLTAFAAGC